MPVVVKSVWGEERFGDELLQIPDRHYWELIETGYCKEVAKLRNLRNAIQDGLKVVPPEETAKFVEKIKKIGLWEE